LEVEWAPAIGALVAYRILALGDGYRREIERALTGLVQESLSPHADVHEVVVEPDRIAILAPRPVELHAPDARAAATIECAEYQHVSGMAGGDRHGRHAGEIARRLATEIGVEDVAQLGHRERRRDGLAIHRVVHHHEARDAVDVARRKSGVVDRVAARLGGQAQYAATGVAGELGVTDTGNGGLLTHRVSRYRSSVHES